MTYVTQNFWKLFSLLMAGNRRGQEWRVIADEKAAQKENDAVLTLSSFGQMGPELQERGLG